MPDAIFDDRRLAAIYDSVDADRSDLDTYVALADEFGAMSMMGGRRVIRVRPAGFDPE